MSGKKLIKYFNFLGVLIVIVLGVLRNEFGQNQFSTPLGRIISLVEIIMIFFFLELKKLRDYRRKEITPNDIIRFQKSYLLFWMIVFATRMLNNFEINTTSLWFILLIWMMLRNVCEYKLLEDLMSQAAFLYFVICFGSIIFMKFGYGLVMNTQYSVVSSIGIRLYGMTQNANTLGPIAALLCIYSFYNKKFLPLLFAGAALYYSVSKTSEAALVVCLVLFVLKRVLKLFVPSQRKIIRWLIIATGSMIIAYVLYKNVWMDWTFTGRSVTWSWYLTNFISHPFRWLTGLSDSFYSPFLYAENMFVDVLCKNGILVFLAFINLIYVMGKQAYKNFTNGYELSFMFYLLMLLRCVTESIFFNTNMGFGDFFYLAFFVFIYETYMRSVKLSVRYQDKKLKWRLL